MSKPQDIFGASTPKTALNKPMFHVQDQKAYNVDGGTSIADTWTKRDLNTVILNQIPGASLGTNSVNLPAGTYYVEGGFVSDNSTGIRSVIASIFKDGAKVLQGTSEWGAANVRIKPMVSGVVTMANSGFIDLRYYDGLGQATIGLGTNNNTGSITDATINSIYSDLKIYQLDATVQTPVLVSDKLYPLPGNCMVTGNMHGLEYVRNGNNQVSIYPGICMDSLNTTVLTLSNQQNLNLPTTINTIFNLFLCSDGVVRYDTDVNGTNIVGTLFRRWIGFVRNNVSGVICGFTMARDLMLFTKASENIITLNVTTTYTQFDHSIMIPISRILEIQYGVRDASVNEYLLASDDGVNESFWAGQSTSSADDINFGVWGAYTYSITTFNPNRYFRASSTVIDLLCHAVRMRR